MEPEPLIGPLLKQLNDALERDVNNGLRPRDITMSQMRVLMELHHADSGELSLKRLETLIGAAQSTVWGLVSRLEKKGLVRTYESPDDSRARIAHISPEGEEACRSCQKDMADHERRLTAGLSAEEVAQLRDLLARVTESFEQS